MSSNFQIRYSRSLRIVRLHFFGRVGLETRLFALRQIAERFHHLAQLRMLVDMRYAVSLMTAGQQRELVDFILGDPVISRARIAVLYSTHYSPSKLSILSMARRGLMSREFLVESEAQAWLLD